MSKSLLLYAHVEDLLSRIEQIIDERLKALAPKKKEESEYITRKEAATILKVTFPTLHDYTKMGWLHSYKMGSRVLYKKQEVEKAIENVQTYKHKKGGRP